MKYKFIVLKGNLCKAKSRLKFREMSGIWKILGWFLMIGMLHQVHAVSIPKIYWAYDLSDQSLKLFEKEEEGLRVNVSGKLSLCHHFDRGQITLDVSGGLPPYTFIWSNGDTSSSRNDLYAGTYTVTVKDSQGVEHQERIVIQPPFPLIVEMDGIEPASCSGTPDGRAKINILFGRGEPYKIIWSHGLEDELEAVELLPGDYTVRVIDMYNCDATLSFEIKSNADSFEVKESISPISCMHGTLGSINLEVTGGTAPYTFIWSNGKSTKDIHDLQQGVYEVIIKDEVGCTITKSFEIESPASVEVKVARVQHNQCYGAEDGEIDIEVEGGKAPYTFSWSNGAKTQNLRTLKGGTYTLKVKDALGCTIESNIVIEEPQAFSVRIETALDLDCDSGEAIGFAWVRIEGGTGPFTILWGNGEEGKQEIEFRDSGEITVEVLDNAGCKVREKVRVSFPFDNSITNKIDFNVRKLSISSEKEVHVL
uniref:SprB repeat-containing protein n=1 Tax=Cecembia sp. TaxID=1898110 RepID=UPI0025C30A39